MAKPSVAADLQEVVRARYAEAATRATEGISASSCGELSACCRNGTDAITSNLYAGAETAELPSGAILGSLGCGNPTALADLQEGETVLDLGSGGGIDVLLSARRVGPTGKAYGLDMTEEMLALARKNLAESGIVNAEFLQGSIESVPLPDNSVDVVISNCVINLSSDKAAVFQEAFRVLKPGGRLAVSDVVVQGEMPADIRRSMELWVGCIAGALEESQFERLLAAAGFEEVSIEPTRVYSLDDAKDFLAGTGLDTDRLACDLDGRVISGFVRARKPLAEAPHSEDKAATACCGSDCCP